MTRPLITLLVGVFAAVGIATVISPAFTWREAILPVLITTAIGGLVLAATARRAILRDRAQALLDAEYVTQRGVSTPDTPSKTDGKTDAQEPDRG